MTSTDLSKFGARELHMVEELLKAQRINGLPEDFMDDGVVPMMNYNSGNVFLTNSNYEVAMVDDNGHLYSFYSSPYDGREGSFEDLMSEYKDMSEEDQEWFEQLHKDYYSDTIMDMKVRKWEDEIAYVEEGQEYYTLSGRWIVESNLDDNTDRDEESYDTALDAFAYYMDSEGCEVEIEDEDKAENRQILVTDLNGTVWKYSYTEDLDILEDIITEITDAEEIEEAF